VKCFQQIVREEYEAGRTAADIQSMTVKELRELIPGEEGVASNGFDLIDDEQPICKSSLKGDLYFNSLLKTIKIDVGTGEHRLQMRLQPQWQ